MLRPHANSETTPHALGAAGEKAAQRYLRHRGFSILATNYKVHGGEIDIIATEKKTLVFVEVKTSSSQKFDDPRTWVPLYKQTRIVHASAVYLKINGINNAPLRYDVIAIDARGEVNHIRDAFRPDNRFYL